jgi:prefoldin subunit 5
MRERIESNRGSPEEARAAHVQSLTAVKEELAKVRKALEDGSKKEQSRVAFLNDQIASLTQKIQDDDQRIENLKEKLTADDTVIQKKAAKFYEMLIREQPFRPYVEFLRVSQSLPMFLEDLGSRIASLRISKTRVDSTKRELNELRATHKS